MNQPTPIKVIQPSDGNHPLASNHPEARTPPLPSQVSPDGTNLAEPLPPPRTRPTVTLALVAAAIAALYFMREVFIPIAVALLLTFMLTPAVLRLRRWGVGKATATLIVVFLAGLAISGFAALVAVQLVDLADNIATYQYNLRAKIQSLRDASPEQGVVERTSELIEGLSKEIEELAEEKKDTSPATTETETPSEPLQVEIIPPKPRPLEIIARAAWPLLGPVATAGIVLVFVVFGLLYREDLRDRMIRLVSRGDLQRTTEAMSEAGQRVSRYLLMQLVVNVLYGLPVGIGLFLIGVPNAPLWGLLAVVLRFIPYVGPAIAAIFPVALSFAVDPGWTMPALTIGLFVLLELVSNNVIEPWLYGSSTGISSVAIIVAAVFWTWLWGPIGLLLSTPLTVCLVVVGRYVPQLAFLDVMLGNEPVLSPAARFYQRLLARDSDEASEVAEAHLAEHSLLETYDEVVLPALRLAEADRSRGTLASEDVVALARSAEEAIEELAEWRPKAAPKDTEVDEADTPPEVEAVAERAALAILTLAARTPLDGVAAAMLALLLQRRGFTVTRTTAQALDHSQPTDATTAAAAAFVCSLHASAPLQLRRIARRLRRHLGGAKLVACIFNGRLDAAGVKEAVATTTADLAAGSLADALAAAAALTADQATAAADRAQIAEGRSQGARSAEDQALAEGAQRSGWAPEEIDTPTYLVCHAYRPGPDGGGDYVEARPRADGTVGFLLADLSHDGVSAAMLSTIVRSAWAAAEKQASDPAELLAALDHRLREAGGSEEPITALAAVLDPAQRRLTLASAGSPNPILIRGGAVEAIRLEHGPPLLHAERPAEVSQVIELKPGDRILLMTEGAVQATSPDHRLLESKGIAELAAQNLGFAGKTFVDRLAAAIEAFTGGEIEDDIVILAIELREAATESDAEAAE